MKKFLSLLLILCVLFLPCCNHSSPLVTQDSVVQLYNSNSFLFNDVVDMVFEDSFYNEMIGYYFFYENEDISIRYKNEPVEYQLPTNIYSHLIECFKLFDDIVNDAYKSNEYTILAVFDQDCKGLKFYINDDIIQYSYCLVFAYYPDVCMENAPSWIYQINDNWFYWGSGQV